MPQHRPPVPEPGGEEARQRRLEAINMLADAMAGPPQDRAQTIARLGGAAKVATLVGRSTRTVQRWASGSIRSPKADALNRLNQADVRDRIARRGINLDPEGRPYRPVRFQARAAISVQGPSKSPTYRYDRRIGVQQPLAINGDTLAGMVDRWASGDNEGAMRLLERDMTRDYADCGESYDPELGLGLRFEQMTDARFYTDAAGEELYRTD